MLYANKYPNIARTVTGSIAVYNDDVVINCDTSTGVVTINLPEIAALKWSTEYKLYVKDASNNCATNNITITAPIGFKINNSSSVILNSNGACARISIVSSTDYIGEVTQVISTGHIIADEGTNLPQQPILDFVGDGVVASNGSGRTLVTISGAVSVLNTAFVMKNGSDSTGLVHRFDKPFLTITAAINAIRAAYPDASRNSSNRFKVIVEDGTYQEPLLPFYPYIDLDLGNSVLFTHMYDDFSAGTVTYSANPSNDFTTKIFGNARIYRHSSAISTIFFGNINARILIQCDTISSDRDDAITFSCGYARVICNKLFNNNTVNPFRQFSHAIEMAQGDIGTAPFPLATLEIVGADIYMVGNDQACPIHFGVSSGNISNPLNQVLSLYNCRVISPLGSGANNALYSCVAVGVTHAEPTGSTLNLYSTVLYSKYGQSIFISNATSKANLTVYYYGSSDANTDSLLVTPDANHSLTEYLKTTGFNISTDVVPSIP